MTLTCDSQWTTRDSRRPTYGQGAGDGACRWNVCLGLWCGHTQPLRHGGRELLRGVQLVTAHQPRRPLPASTRQRRRQRWHESSDLTGLLRHRRGGLGLLGPRSQLPQPPARHGIHRFHQRPVAQSPRYGLALRHLLPIRYCPLAACLS